VDLVFVGDAEEALPEFLELLRGMKREGVPRAERVREAARVEGVYAPALYELEREERNGLLVPVPRGDAPFPVRRRILYELDRFPFPDRILVPHGEIVHDRVSVELMRGCPVGCRFCQAGYVYRPKRERHPNQVRDAVIRSVRATGYDQFSLSSLNSGEYGAIEPLMFDLMERFEPERVSISLSSLHASTITPRLAEQVRRVRKSGFTIAPEAGTQRLRDVINKNLSEEQILTASRLAFEAGWEQLKLYFMIGLPTETEEDVDGIVELAHAILAAGRRAAPRKGRARVTLSASSFVPKPGTPFQWVGMDRVEILRRKQERIAAGLRRGVRFRHHDCETSRLEAVFSRGDRALGEVLERAWRAGARLDGWDEQFRPRAWSEAFASAGLDPDAYAYREIDTESRLPWDVVDPGVSRSWLAAELRRARAGETLSICGPGDCHGCAPFARDCVKGIVAETDRRPLDPALAPLATPAAAGSGPAGEPARTPPPRKGSPLPTRRYRARFGKSGRLRFLGHLDLTRHLLRALRRAGLPLVYSQGFNPKPRVSFAPALAVGVASEGEYLDFELSRPLPAEGLRETINAALPAGIRFRAVREIRAGLPGLGDAIRAARYRATLDEGAGLAAALAEFESAGPARVHRTGKDGKERVFDLAEEILELERRDERSIAITLAHHPDRASLRPDEALRAILGDLAGRTRMVREELLVDWKGRLVDPLLAAAAASGSDAAGALR
jgi:radical SAM family uncharacterized protein/radical SAM-linked protein